MTINHITKGNNGMLELASKCALEGLGKFLSQVSSLKSLVFLLLSLVSCLSSLVFAQPSVSSYDQLVQAIHEVQQTYDESELGKMREYWNIGKLIETHVDEHRLWADYSIEMNERLPKDLLVNGQLIRLMREFARVYPEAVPSRDLTWSHYLEVLDIPDVALRESLLDRAEKEQWKVVDLRAEIKKVIKPAAESLPAPGELYVYRIELRLETRDSKQKLVLDLGFGNFLELPSGKEQRFKTGDIVRASFKSDVSSLESFSSLLSQVSSLPSHTYSALISQIHDGDTFDAIVDLGFGFTAEETFRLSGIDAPELDTPEGVAAKQYLYDEFTKTGTQVLIRSNRKDKFNRYLADVFIPDGKTFRYVNAEMLRKNLATTMELEKAEWGDYLAGKSNMEKL